jgi:Fructose-bisphosphate aldolase class-I
MSTVESEPTARAIVADGKGILAVDETPGTLSKRFEAHRIASTPDTRRVCRELFFTTRGIAEYIGRRRRTRRRPSEDKFNARYQFSAFSFQRLLPSGDEPADSCQLIADSQKRSEP